MKNFTKVLSIIFIWVFISLSVLQSFAQDIGDRCDGLSSCQPMNSQCQMGTCRCNPGFQKSVLNNYQCLQEANRLDAPCSEPVQCTALGTGVHCYYGACKCQNDYIPDSTNTRCFRKAYLNDQCNSNDRRCYGTNIICGDRGVCTCSPGFMPHTTNNTACVVGVRFINDNCTDSMHCSMALGEASCVYGKCECNYGFGPDFNRTKCIRAAKLNDYCSNNDECAAGLQPGYQSRVSCDFNYCVCRYPYIGSEDRTRCNEPRNLNESCTETSECSHKDTIRAVCNNGTCQCEDGFIPGAENICIKIADINEDCDDVDIFCGGENVLCEYDVCVCAEGYQLSAQNTSSCIREVHKLYENCTENIQCSAKLGDYSVCMNGSCVCQGGYTATLNDTACIKIIKPKSVNCTENSHCLISVGNYSVCVNGTCNCQSGFILSENKTRCVNISKPEQPVLPGDVNQTCTTNANCSGIFGNHSECKSDRCICQSGYSLIESQKDCIKISKLGDTCSKVEECHLGVDKNHTSRVECTKSKCTCKQGFVASKDHTKCNGAEKTAVASILLMVVTIFFTKVLH